MLQPQIDWSTGQLILAAGSASVLFRSPPTTHQPKPPSQTTYQSSPLPQVPHSEPPTTLAAVATRRTAATDSVTGQDLAGVPQEYWDMGEQFKRSSHPTLSAEKLEGQKEWSLPLRRDSAHGLDATSRPASPATLHSQSSTPLRHQPQRPSPPLSKFVQLRDVRTKRPGLLADNNRKKQKAADGQNTVDCLRVVFPGCVRRRHGWLRCRGRPHHSTPRAAAVRPRLLQLHL
ncbi:hypothetical protein J4Q44_G00337640 [Coregonus suidteri]|uniref:Uncharacterized protein n=1 Tax=Coregonus suidteri TaxID=861788 RepID=A0AAN8L0A7_9TELE